MPPWRKLAGEVKGAKVRGVAADVSTAAGGKALVAALPEVDILITNAGNLRAERVCRHTGRGLEPLLRDQRDVRACGMSRAYLPGMLKRNWGPHHLHSSESALNIPTEMIHYGTTKTAQLAIARGLAKLTRGTAVTVNSVLPGPDAVGRPFETFVKGLARQKQPGVTEAEAAANFVKQHRPGLAAGGGLPASEEIRQHRRLRLPRRRAAVNQWRSDPRRGRHRRYHCLRYARPRWSGG